MRLSLSLVQAALMRAALFTLLWWALVDGRPGSWAVGSAGVVLATVLSLYLLPPVRTHVSGLGLLRFLAFFIHQSLRAGVQVAWIALRPGRVLQPGIHEICLRLPEGISRVLLANTLSLLPGTLSVELQGRKLCLHVLDERAPIETEVRAIETRLAHMLGLKLEPI